MIKICHLNHSVSMEEPNGLDAIQIICITQISADNSHVPL